MPEIDLGEPGTYEITLWAALSCEGAGCASSLDSIKIVFNEDSINPQTLTIDLASIGFIKRWMPFSFLYTSYTSKLDVKILFYLKNTKIKSCS